MLFFQWTIFHQRSSDIISDEIQPFQHRIGCRRFNEKILKSENSIEKMSGGVNFRWNNIISNNFSTFLECFDSRDLWLAIKISRKIEHRTSACRQFHRNRIYFLLSIWKLNLIQRSNQWNFHCNEKFLMERQGAWRSYLNPSFTTFYLII